MGCQSGVPQTHTKEMVPHVIMEEMHIVTAENVTATVLSATLFGVWLAQGNLMTTATNNLTESVCNSLTAACNTSVGLLTTASNFSKLKYIDLPE